MKKSFLRVSMLVVSAIIFLAAAGPQKIYAAEPGKSEISVSGSGSINVNPDVAYVSLGVSTQDASAKTALENNNTIMENVVSAIKEMGIAERDIRTTNFTMYESYDYMVVSGRDKATGYTVNNGLTVVVRDIDQLGDLLGVAADAGANSFSGIEFSLLDNASVYKEALALAVQEAAGKAEAIAAALGGTLDGAVTVTESNNYYSPVYAGALNSSVSFDAASVPVQAGKLTVTANVQVSYGFTK